MEDELGLVLRMSRQEEELRLAQEYDRAMGIGPSGHSKATEKITPQEGDG